MKNLCFGLFLFLLGIEYSHGILQNVREMQNHCFHEGGFCINTLIPQPRRRRPPRRRMQGRRRNMPRTKTRKGSRAGGGGPPTQPGPQPGSPANPPNQPPQQGFNQPAQQPNNNWGNNLFSNPFAAWMLFGTRKKRQAAAEPPEPGEIPQRMPGQPIMSFLNQHCLKAEPDFSCSQTGGWCCRPHP